MLDEPSATQSDPSVLELQLRVVTKQSATKTARIKRIKASEDNGAVEKWIRDISDLHRSKPPPSVHYQKTMPDIDNLMQVKPLTITSTITQWLRSGQKTLKSF